MIKPFKPEYGDEIRWLGYVHKWGFYDEVGLAFHGDFNSRAAAEQGFNEYCNWLDDSDKVPAWLA